MERTARQDRMVMEGYEAHIYSHVDTPQVTLHYHAGSMRSPPAAY